MHDLVTGHDEAIRQADEFRALSPRMILNPNHWMSYPNRIALEWTIIRFHSTEVDSVPDDAFGVYTFVVIPSIAGHIACSYLLYVGETERSFRHRYREYLRDQRGRARRPHIYEMLTKWRQHVWFCYAPIGERELVRQIEDDLIEAYLPPFNREFPAAVRSPMGGAELTDDHRTTFPALRCHMGDWYYYVTYMKFSDAAHWIERTDQIHKSESLRDMIQRELTRRVEPIADYLVEQPERFFNAIVVGVYGGDPQWYPLDINESPVLGTPDLDDSTRYSVGLLMLDGEESLFAIDGQHRIEAIKNALEREPSLADEDQCMIFVAHKTSQEGLVRTRRLFSTLNRYAKKVSKGEIVALDEDDAFAIVTRRLVEDFELLQGFVHFGKTAPLTPTDRGNLTSVLALYEIVQQVYVPDHDTLSDVENEAVKKLKVRRPPDSLLDAIYNDQVLYWNLLRQHIEEYQELFDSDPSGEVAGNYRNAEGGHLMFRPAGQQVFAKATNTLLKRGRDMDSTVAVLSSVPMDLANAPWRKVLWEPSTRKVNASVSRPLCENLLLYMIGEESRGRDYSYYLGKYRELLDEPRAELPSP